MTTGRVIHGRTESGNRFVFLIEENSEAIACLAAPTRAFRDPVGLFILRQLASGFRRAGYAVSEPRPAKACDALCEISAPKLRLFAVVLVERVDGKVRSILELRLPRRWRRGPLSEEEHKSWVAACAQVPVIAAECLAGESIQLDLAG